MRFLLMLAVTAMALCSAAQSSFVKVSPGGHFTLGDSLYTFVGTNMWYAPVLASPGEAGNLPRLRRELDFLHSIGVNNIRVMAGADAPADAPHHVSPVLQKSPGVYDTTQLIGLDRLLVELEKRHMQAVIYLNNAWEWSGGYGSYLQWTGHGIAPVPGIDGYNEYVSHVKDFVLSPQAVELAVNHARNIVSRTNSITGIPYSQSPAIMAWQICNEPRAFSAQGKEALLEYIRKTSEAIRTIDPNHLVSTGSEGKFGCEVDIDLWRRIHALPSIDYAVIHIWPFNWRWVSEPELTTGAQQAVDYAMEYMMSISAHWTRCISPLSLRSLVIHAQPSRFVVAMMPPVVIYSIAPFLTLCLSARWTALISGVGEGRPFPIPRAGLPVARMLPIPHMSLRAGIRYSTPIPLLSALYAMQLHAAGEPNLSREC